MRPPSRLSRILAAAIALTIGVRSGSERHLSAQSALTAGTSAKTPIRPGDERRHLLTLLAGQADRLEIDTDTALELSIIDAAGAVVASIPDTSEEIGTIVLTVLAHTTGAYTVALRVLKGEEAGAYTLRFLGEHDATEADEHRNRAEALMREGIVLARTTTRESRLAAADRFMRSIELSRTSNDELVEVLAESQLGKVFNRLGEARKAADAYTVALELFRKAGDRRQQASTLNNLGLERRNLGDFPGAIEALEQSAAAFHELHDKVGERSPHNNLGLTYLDLGELAKAQSEYELSLALARETQFKRSEAFALAGLAAVAHAEGRLQIALDETTQARDIWHSLDDKQLEAQMLGNIGLIQAKLGDPVSALDYMSRSRDLQKLAPSARLEAVTLRNIADAYVQLREPGKALSPATESLSFWHEMGNRAEEAAATAQLAEILELQARSAEAVETFGRARTLARDAGNRAGEVRALTGLSRVYLTLGDHASASARATDAVALAGLANLRIAQEQALVALGRVEAAANDLNAARGHLEHAVELAESIRLSLAGPDRRTSFFAGVREKYDLLIDVLMRLHERDPADGLDAQALELSERARARGLLDLLGEARANIREGIDPELLAREQALHTSIVGKTSAPDESLQGLLRSYRELQDDIRARSPRYAALVRPSPVLLGDIENEILDDHTALVEYALGEQHSYVWVVTPTSLTSRRLAGRAEIELAARRAYDALANPNAVNRGAALRALARLLLDPIADQLRATRLAVVTDGLIQYIPFAALPDVLGRPLISSHEIVHLPSAATLRALRQETRTRPAPPRSLFVLGDPVFSSRDPRVRTSARHIEPAPAATIERSARESGASVLERLYFSRVEARNIAALSRDQPSSALLDFDANLDRVKDGSVGSFRFVHFATHGLLNNLHPELSGLVFSLVDSQGHPREGFLPAYDVYNLHLNADLVVLSACQTALGDDVRGEGLVGLTRGFMYAGAARVVSSLWRVPDGATAALMARFYRAILVDHLAPAAALREAQRSVRADPRWSAPYYWAGFVIQGEWR